MLKFYFRFRELCSIEQINKGKKNENDDDETRATEEEEEKFPQSN